MNAINEVNIRVARRSEQHRVALGMTRGGVSGQIVRAKIRFHFNNTPSNPFALLTADNELTQQLTRDDARITIEERAAKELCSDRRF